MGGVTMTSRTTVESTGAGVDRYRRREEALWRYHGIEPTERHVTLGSPACRLRVLEVGAGEPLLFVHGTVGPGGWPSLVQALPGHRCLLLDRPGWGGSTPVDFTRDRYATTVTDIVRGVLDALDIQRATVVGGSIGNVWALRTAERYPARVERVVLFGGSPLVPDVPVPGFIRLVASPVGALMVRLPMSPGRIRSILTDSGHGPSLADGRIPRQFLEWRATASRSGAMRHERDMVRAIVHGSSYRPGLTFTDAELRAVQTPTLCLFGTGDPTGSVGVWQRAMTTLTAGELVLVHGAGHMPWFDDVDLVADTVRRFLR
jgi:pimeloyl-ACP methyl ester carboxylesterase